MKRDRLTDPHDQSDQSHAYQAHAQPAGRKRFNHSRSLLEPITGLPTSHLPTSRLKYPHVHQSRGFLFAASISPVPPPPCLKKTNLFFGDAKQAKKGRGERKPKRKMRTYRNTYCWSTCSIVSSRGGWHACKFDQSHACQPHTYQSHAPPYQSFILLFSQLTMRVTAPPSPPKKKKKSKSTFRTCTFRSAYPEKGEKRGKR